MNPKALVGIGIAAAAGIGLLIASEGDASAGSSDPGKKPLPQGGTREDLALATTVSLTTQNIPDVKEAIAQWNAAKDPLTAGSLSFVLDGALAGQNLAQWTPDGEKGSPLLRAFGLRVLQLEGRPDLLRVWSKAWKTLLPLLSEELSKKAGGIKPSVAGGTTSDPVPPAELVEAIQKAVASGDTAAMRRLADRLEQLGFKEAADDLRAAAKAIEDSKVEPPKPVAPLPPTPATPAAPRPANIPGRVYVVLSGDNPSKIAKKLTGNGNRFPELVSANVPPKKKGKDGGFTTLFAGERLRVPANWPEHPEAIPGTPGGAPPAATPRPSAPALPAANTAGLETTIVQSGDGFIRITKRLGVAEGRWRELRDANVPRDADGRTRAKDTDAKGGIKPILQPGQRLFVPASFGPAVAVAGDGMSEADMAQRRAGMVGLNAHLGKANPAFLAEFQRDHGIEATGQYGVATAVVLSEKYGMVPPIPHTWGDREKANRQKFADYMFQQAKRDPQRRDEFRRAAFVALGKAA